jgi:hypothetical protein
MCSPNATVAVEGSQIFVVIGIVARAAYVKLRPPRQGPPIDEFVPDLPAVGPAPETTGPQDRTLTHV